MIFSIYQVDAFASKIFKGNPAAVIPVQEWPTADLMQEIAMENNLSETVFFAKSNDKAADFNIRWFTPLAEIDLCGHATLAAAYILFDKLSFPKQEITFHSKSGFLKVYKENEIIRLDFPSWEPKPVSVDLEVLCKILGTKEIVAVYKQRDLLVELNNELAVRDCSPDFSLMRKHFDKMIITAQGENADFVSRFFAPGVGIDEDPVTGSAHSQLIPYWSRKLGKNDLHALQLSKRGGELFCTQLDSDRVTMSGKCVFYMKGEIVL